MFLFILGALDVIAGGMLWATSGSAFAGSMWMLAFGILFLLKGLWSVLSATAAGFYFDVMGVFDFIAGALLLASYLGFAGGWFVYFAVIMIIKGLYSFGMGFASS